MKLFISPGSCSLSCHLAARELHIPVEIVKVNLKTKESDIGDYRKINQKGSVPALMLDQENEGELLTEAAVILQYLGDLRAEKHFLPKAGLSRYRVLEWLNFIATELHKGFSPLFKADTPEDYKKIATENLRQKLDFLNRHLEGRDFLMGKEICVADFYLFTVLRWVKAKKPEMNYPNLNRYYDQMNSRPLVQETLKEEGLI